MVIAILPETVWLWTLAFGRSPGAIIDIVMSGSPEDALGTERKHRQEDHMAGENAEAGIDSEADRLADAQHHRARKAPQIEPMPPMITASKA
jgi:hypothetical protein